MTEYCIASYYMKIKNKNKYYKLLMWNPMLRKWQSCHGGYWTWKLGAENRVDVPNIVMCVKGLHATSDPWAWRIPLYGDASSKGWKMGLFEVTSKGIFEKYGNKIVTKKMTIGGKPLMTWRNNARPRDVYRRMRKLGIYE